MCGIGGKIYFDTKKIKSTDLEKISGKIEHRGPDDSGMFMNPNRNVGFVSRRLAIQDLSRDGHQPMSFKNRYWITFNGEIYNFLEKRQELELQGYKFKSLSDTEIILALYDKYGLNCLEHLRGMFAFAIYDHEKEQVFIARDRLGKKPLKYFCNSSVFIFASELKAILTQEEVRPAPDFLAIHHYLTYGYCPAPLTGFKRIYKLKPAHYMLINLKNNRILQKRYWHLDYATKLKLSESEWKERIVSELETATKMRMIADVPIGAFLSGGVDSSAIVALMARNSTQPINTFTVGFHSKEHDESEYAQAIATLYKTNHTKLMVSPQSIEILPDLARLYEEPFADSSSVVTYLVSKLAKQYVTVALNGDGGDENFAGYDRHIRLKRDYWLSQNPWTSHALSILQTFWPRARKFYKKQLIDPRIRYLGYKQFYSREEKRQLYKREFVPLVRDNSSQQFWLDQCEDAETSDIRDQLLYSDFVSYFPDDLLTKVDMASMAVGLEARSPFTDHKVVELAAQIPYELKVKGRETKYILKKALEGIVPNENLYREKIGFSIPLSDWFTKELKPYAMSVLMNRNSAAYQLFKPEQVKSMLDQHSLKNDFGPRLWSLLALELWWDAYLR